MKSGSIEDSTKFFGIIPTHSLFLLVPYYFYKISVLNGEYHVPRNFSGDGYYHYAYKDRR